MIGPRRPKTSAILALTSGLDCFCPPFSVAPGAPLWDARTGNGRIRTKSIQDVTVAPRRVRVLDPDDARKLVPPGMAMMIAQELKTQPT